MPWCSQLWAIWGKEVEPRLGPGPGSPCPRGPSRSGAPSGPAALWPGLPEATLLWRLPPSLPPGPRLLKAAVQGWSTAPSAKHIQNLPPGLEASTCWDQGLAHSPALHPPSAPRCPGTPPAELNLPRSLLPAPLRTGPHTCQAKLPCWPFPQQQADASGPARGTAHSGDLCCPAALPGKPLRLSFREA